MAEEKTITLTETELQTRIDDAVKSATESLISKHNSEMAGIRTKYEKQLKEKDMSAEDLAKARAEEIAQANQQELSELRTFKKETIIKERLAKEGLPSYFLHDTRLLSAEEGELDKIIKVVKGEYEATQTKGSTHSSVVQVGGKKPASSEDENKAQVYEETGNAIASLFK